jgi:hypothetical protein
LGAITGRIADDAKRPRAQRPGKAIIDLKPRSDRTRFSEMSGALADHHRGYSAISFRNERTARWNGSG